MRRNGVGRRRGATRLGLAAIAVLTLGLAGLSPPQAVAAPPADWPQFRGGPTHQASDQPSTITPANVSTVGPAWNTVGGQIVSSPAVVGGVVYVGDTGGPFANGSLLAFPAICAPAASCAPLWAAPMANDVASSPAVAGGVVYVGSLDNHLYAFDAAGVQGCTTWAPKTCEPLWSADTMDHVNSSPVVAGGRVYIGSDADRLYAFDAAGVTNCRGVPKTCEPLWSALTGGDVYSSPAVSGGVVYVGSDDGSLYTFDAAGVTNCAGTPKTCAPLWTAPTGAPVQTSPAVANGVVYVGSNAFYAYDAAGATNCSGSPKVCAPLWTATTGSMFASPAVAGGVVYASAFDRNLYAFDAAGTTGCAGVPKVCSPLWTALTSSVASAIGISSPLVVNGLLFVGTGIGDHQVHAFDATGVTNCSGTPKTCTPLWSGEAMNAVRSSPAAAGDYLYVGTEVGLRAFSLPLTPEGAFHPAGPRRLLDTREEGGPLAPGETRTLSLLGPYPKLGIGVPSVVLNVAVTDPTAGGWLTMFPSGTARPLASSINFAKGQTVSNTVVAKVGANGALDIFNYVGSTHVVVDLQGWFGFADSSPGARYTPVSPTRIIDTRPSAAMGAGETLRLPVGAFGVPADGATAVVLNVTVTQPTTGGWLTLFPAGTGRPLASNINFAAGQTVANKVVVELGVSQNVDVYNFQGDTHVVVDVEGWFGYPGYATGVRYHPVAPVRILDTRATVAVGPQGTVTLPVTGVGGVPATGVTGVVLNVTVTDAVPGGFLTVFPSGESRPLASTMNFTAGQTVANAAFAKVGANGKVAIYNNQGKTHVIVDVAGWFGV